MSNTQEHRGPNSLRRGTKKLCYAIATLLVLPGAALELILRHVFGRDVLFAAQSELLALVPGKLGWFLRNAYLHLTLAQCPFDCCFNFGVLFTHANARVGDRVYIGAYSVIGMAEIGDDVLIADGVQVLSGSRQHSFQDASLRIQDQPQHFSVVHIGSNAWVGSGAILMADVGANCVIGAGSVVTQPVPANSVAVGVPSRVIRSVGSALPRNVAASAEGYRAG